MKWSDKEIDILRDNLLLNSVEMVSLFNNRTYDSIVQKRAKLGLQWNKEQKWSNEDIEILKNNRFITSEELSNTFLNERTILAIDLKRSLFKLPFLVNCACCGKPIVKNNQFDICQSCKKNDKYFNQSFMGKYRSYKFGAERRGYSWELSTEEFKTFWNTDCFYCRKYVETVGIDRVDNKLGYTIANSVPCCSMCNEMKLDYSKSEWINQMKNILNNLGETL